MFDEVRNYINLRQSLWFDPMSVGAETREQQVADMAHVLQIPDMSLSCQARA